MTRLKVPPARSRRGRWAPGAVSQPRTSRGIALLKIAAAAGNPHSPASLRNTLRPQISGAGNAAFQVAGMWQKQKTPPRHTTTSRRRARASSGPLCPRLHSAFCAALSGLGWLIPLQAKNKISKHSTAVISLSKTISVYRLRQRRRREVAR